MLKAHEALSISNAHKAIKVIIPNVMEAIRNAALNGHLSVYYHAKQHEDNDDVDKYLCSKLKELGYWVRTEFFDYKSAEQPVKGWTISWGDSQ